MKKIDTKGAAKKSLKKIGGFRKEFVEFINRGNVMDLAVGIVVGSAFTAIVNSLVKDLIMPLVSLVGGGFDFTTLSVDVAGATLNYGNLIQNIVNFLIIAFVVFLMIKFMTGLKKSAEKLKKQEEEAAKEAGEEKVDETVVLLREIRDSLKKKK
jgi:large conductance mechanosensitive channel